MKLEVKKEDLEKALLSEKKDKAKGEHECGDECKCDENQEIGFHKGCLNTLVGERNELIKMIQNVEAIMSAHIKRLQELGVKIDTKKQ